MAPITKRRRFRLFALTKPNLFRLFKLYFNATIRHALYLFMGAVAKRCFGSKPAGTPGIYFTRLHSYANGFGKGDAGQVFVRYRFHLKLF